MGEMKMQRDEKEKYTIAVAGMGYVGLSFAPCLHSIDYPEMAKKIRCCSYIPG